MNFEELSEIMTQQAGVNICPICGTPYRKYNGNQKTCAAPECKREWKNRYFRKRRERLMREGPETFRRYRREAQRKSRNKARYLNDADSEYEKLQEYWEKREDAVTGVKEGMTYAERQVENTLASVPKIDVEGFLKGVNDGKLQQADGCAGRGSEEARSESEADQQGECADQAEDTVL